MDSKAIFPGLDAITQALAKITYNDVSNDERLVNIKPQFDSTCKLFYLSAQNSKKQQVAYIPMPHSKDIDLELIRTMQGKLADTIIYIAILDNTGNILYYRMTEGLGV